MSDAEAADRDDLEASLDESVHQRLREQEPSEDRKVELLAEHDHHLVRHTTSKLSVDAGEDLDGVDVDATAEIPDCYCFSCEEWVGLSGVDLRGTPRSRADAHYHNGPPADILDAREDVRGGLDELAKEVYYSVDSVETQADAFQFVADELERIQGDLDE